ncbi:hypothetical protein [Streptococcus uberis]|uniref:hypothetical protein n=1 Tax=Streptococcus uberis TaxID=1349 RepID=UPI001FF65CDE|nr:hypothetical protein [Streptococcus uberis]MCK1213513.1 hypothetical protein [Streptococcus uberis]
MKHKAIIHFIPLSKFVYLIPFLLGMIPLICYKLITQIYKILDGSYTNVNFNNFLFWSIVFFIASILFSILLFFKKKYSLKSKLKQIIYNNNFYSKNDNVKEISKSSFFLFYKKDSKLFLEFHPNGLNVANRMNDLQPIIETALRMYVEEIDDSKPNYTLYVLSKDNGGNRIDVSNKW